MFRADCRAASGEELKGKAGKNKGEINKQVEEIAIVQREQRNELEQAGMFDHLQTSKHPTKQPQSQSSRRLGAGKKRSQQQKRRKRRDRKEDVKETMFTPRRRRILLPERVVKAKENVKGGHMRRKREKLAAKRGAVNAATSREVRDGKVRTTTLAMCPRLSSKRTWFCVATGTNG
ncbi:hypothetical protein M440DRAFT_245911 [Trichoderma longibrachiatum ATCC 18648]|uniref:Uncharacterized protein n=1 Tax=Trichoderma longibrachiatum ATCC 18648 TaxID=983965 RepID=A0A2T4CDT4_TRILO|nr:hypothetical protein M440DRAFT_245911 [Trichoderma longibrachiatum ATCC 18648]